MRIDEFVSGTAVDSVTDVLLLIGADGAILDANAAALDCYGYSRPELLALTLRDVREPNEEPRPVEPGSGSDISDAVREESHRRADGTPVAVEVRSVSVGSNGESATLEVIRDITERKRAERALHESNAQHAAMISNISDVIGIMGVDGRMKYKSPNITKWFGWQPEDLIGTDGWLTVHPYDLERLQQEFMSLLAEDDGVATVEYRYLCKDGGYKWIELTATNRTHDPNIGGVLLNYHDISERKQLERLGKDISAITDVIGSVAEMRDPYTAGHQRRVAELASEIAREMGMDAADVSDIRVAGLMHDVGKMAVPAEILAKPTRLSRIEMDLVKVHAEAGYAIIASARMHDPIPELVYQHHERCDGSGYPQGLCADDLQLGSKILMVADVVEAMMSHRPYRAALGLDAALDEIERGGGAAYDADVTSACLRLFRERGFAFSEL